MVIVVMGPAGSGKSTVGRLLTDRLGWSFVDGDDHHQAANLARLRRNEPLTDEDRVGWLADLRAIIARAVDRRESLVLACSALSAAHRERLAGGLRPVRFVYLRTPPELLRRRLETRQGHVAGPSLIESQLDALEEPGEPAITLDGTEDPDAIVGHIRLQLGV
jgi:gluconokinase